MRLVIIESPYAGDIETNVEYARMCVRDSLSRGEAPIASHLLFTQPGILRDHVKEEREWGINAGLAWRRVAEVSAVYTDLGISSGMEYGIKAAEEAGVPVEYRSLANSSHLRRAARTVDEWHEDHGFVVWWTWQDGKWLGEPSYIGSPLCDDWPGYHTHWTPHPQFPAVLNEETA